MNNYQKELVSLKNAGWLTQSEFDRYYNSPNEDEMRRGVYFGINKRDAYNANEAKRAALIRTGGLDVPSGGNWDDRYFLKFTGFTKAELEEAASPQYVDRGSDASGRRLRDRLVEPDLNYYVQERFMSTYDPTYARKHLSGSAKWGLQQDAVGSVIARAGQLKYERVTLPRLKKESKIMGEQKQQARFASWNIMGSDKALSNTKNVSGRSLTNMFPLNRSEQGVNNLSLTKSFEDRKRPTSISSSTVISGGIGNRSNSLSMSRPSDKPSNITSNIVRASSIGVSKGKVLVKQKLQRPSSITRATM